jgi:hypothetical protein
MAAKGAYNYELYFLSLLPYSRNVPGLTTQDKIDAQLTSD